MTLRTAKRKQVKIKICLQGVSGSGKTIGALNTAYGLCGSWDKIAVIDTENFSASLFSDLGEFQILNITPPFSPEKYIEAICLIEQKGIEVVIIDSITHEWEYILETHAAMLGNSFTNWGKITPRHNAFMQKVLQSHCHVIATVRTKQDYVLNEKNGKQVPEKVGLKPIQRDDLDYDFTLGFELDLHHNANATKDRTGLFAEVHDFKITQETGKQILRWCNQGEPMVIDRYVESIKAFTNLKDLYTFYNKNPHLQRRYYDFFTEKKAELQSKLSLQNQ